jgi:anti-anti-sigma regulatory factor
MPTQITQIDDAGRAITIFRVEGELLKEDAELLSRIARDASSSNGNSITIDLADLDFMDSEAASILKRMEREDAVVITGTEIFLQTIVDAAEKRTLRN